MTVDFVTKKELEANNKKLVDALNKSMGEKFATKEDLKKELQDLEKRMDEKFSTMENKFKTMLAENNKALVQQLGAYILNSPVLDEKIEAKVKTAVDERLSTAHLAWS